MVYNEKDENWKTVGYKRIDLNNYTEDEIKKALFLTNLLGNYYVEDYVDGSNYLKASQVATLSIKSEDTILVKLINELMTDDSMESQITTTDTENLAIKVDDYICGVENVGTGKRAVCGWVDTDYKEGKGYVIQADDEYKGHRGTYVLKEDGEITKLKNKLRISE